MKTHKPKRSLRPGRFDAVLPAEPAVPPAPSSVARFPMCTRLPVLSALEAYEDARAFCRFYFDNRFDTSPQRALLAGFVHGYGSGWREQLRLWTGTVSQARRKLLPRRVVRFKPLTANAREQAQAFADYYLSSADLGMPEFMTERDFRRMLTAVREAVEAAYRMGHHVGAGDDETP